MSFLVILLNFSVIVTLVSPIQIQISTGTIEGKVLNATYSPLGQQSGYAFLGVPYSEPPIGELRFRKPRPRMTWQGVLETKEYKPACLSDAARTYKRPEGGPISEDCLYLNVFTNDYCLEKNNCAVMVVVHGGSFLIESASAFDPEIMVNNFVGQNRNIVVVTINYRLGIFGFGQLNGKQGTTADHNLALWDVLETVKWARREIGNFGGDLNRITLTGHSAGAALSSFFSNSPLTKGLIHQQIIMSGPLPQISPLTNTKAMTVVAVNKGCLPENTGFDEIASELIEKSYDCLRKLSSDDLLNEQLWVLKNTSFFMGTNYLDGEIMGSKINQSYTMIGTTAAENRDSMYITEKQNLPRKAELLEQICDHIAYEIYENPENFSKQCQAHYEKVDDAKFLADDMEFYSAAINSANSHVSKSTKVFVYSYVYEKAGAAFKKYLPTVPSPQHSEDLIYIFGTHRGTMAAKDYIIEHIYSGLFANFVNFGDPSPSETQKWEEYSPEKREYFEIDFSDNFTMPGMKEYYYSRAHNFWNNPSFKKHYKQKWPHSLDTFVVANLINPITSHLTNDCTDKEKSLGPMRTLFDEREAFLTSLKSENIAGGLSLLLIIASSIVLLAVITLAGCQYFKRKSRNGYQPL